MVTGVTAVLEAMVVPLTAVLVVSVETHPQLQDLVNPQVVTAVMAETQETAVLAVRLTEDLMA